RIEREIAAEAFFFGDVEDLDGGGEVRGGDAVGFEESDLGVGDAPADLAGDELREFVHSVPAFGVLLERDDEVTRLLLGLFKGIHEDEIGFGDGGGVEFLFVRVIGADGVDVNTRGQILTGQYGMRRSGGGRNNFGVAHGSGCGL